MKKSSSHTAGARGWATPALAALLAAAAITTMSLYGVRVSMMYSPAPLLPALLAGPTPAEVEVALHRAGVDPERLAAAGALPGEVAGVIAAAETYLGDHWQDLLDADQDLHDKANARDALERKVTGGLGTEQDADALAQAKAAHATSRAARDALLDGLFDAAIATLGGDAKAALATVRGNSAWDLPVQYLAADREEPQWVQLRDALANLRISDKLGEDPDPVAQQLVALAGGDAGVSGAESGLDNLPQIQQQWNTALGL